MTSEKEYLAQAIELHQKNPVADLHIDFLLTHQMFGYDITKRHSNPIPYSPFVNHADIPRLNDAGVTIVGAGLVSVPFKFLESRRLPQVKGQMDYLKRVCAENPDKIKHIQSKADFIEAQENGTIAVIPGMEGSHPLLGDLDRLDIFHEMGVRYWTLAHFSGNEACDCQRGIYNDSGPGLTSFGEKLVTKIQDLGMILDLAHTEREAFLDAAQMSQNPMIVSHTGIKGVFDLWRNIDDEQLEAVAKAGGVVGIIVAPEYLGGSKFRPLSDVADHIIYVADKIGFDHVGIGSDLDGWIPTMPKGFSDISDLPKITADLLSRGVSEKEAKQFLGGNVIRVIEGCLK